MKGDCCKNYLIRIFLLHEMKHKDTVHKIISQDTEINGYVYNKKKFWKCNLVQKWSNNI